MNKCTPLILLTILISCSTATENIENQEKLIGTKIYSYEGDLQILFEQWKDVGINSIFASTELLSDDKFKSLAKEYGIKTFAILPIFYAPEETSADSSIFAITNNGSQAVSEWVRFACPSHKEFRQSKVDYIQDFVKKHNPDVISLDFIRHFSFWEKIYPDTTFDSIPNTCFDRRCVSGFFEYLGIDPTFSDSPMDSYELIKSAYYQEWITWKCDLITSMVAEIVKSVKEVDPDIEVNLHAIPWRDQDFGEGIMKIIGQDFVSLSEHLDYISPMTYSHMVKQDADWVSDVVTQLYQKTSLKVLPSIQVNVAYLNDELTIDEFQRNLTAALEPPSSGVILWNWDQLVSSEEKLNLFKKELSGR